MIRRRYTLVAMAGGLIGMPALAVSKPLVLQPVATPEPMAQIVAGGPTGLLGVSVNGADTHPSSAHLLTTRKQCR